MGKKRERNRRRNSGWGRKVMALQDITTVHSAIMERKAPLRLPRECWVHCGRTNNICGPMQNGIISLYAVHLCRKRKTSLCPGRTKQRTDGERKRNWS